MSYNDEIRRQAIEEAKPSLLKEGRLEGKREELARVLSTILDTKPRLRTRYAAALEAAAGLEELRRLETAIMRDLGD